MKISEIPEYKDKVSVLKMEEDVPLMEAVNEMCRQNYSSVVVTKGGHLSGIITERDVMTRVVNMRRNPEELTLQDVMTPNPKTAKEDELVVDALARMHKGQFRNMPVIDDENSVVGLVSQNDFVAYTWPQILRRASENAKSVATMGATQAVLIIVAVMLYTIALVFTMQ
jgi:CBS domain-containing protein